MKKTKSFVMAIIATVFLGLDLINELICLPLLSAIVAYSKGLGIILIFTLILIIAATGTNIIMISVSKSNNEQYLRSSGLVKTAIVINSILLGLLLICVVISFTFSAIVVSIILILAIIFYSIDFYDSKNNAEKDALNPKILEQTLFNIASNQNCEKPVETKQEAKPLEKQSEKKEDTGSLKAKLKELADMKKQGLIDDKDYEELKKSYISKEVSK